ncbi:dipeptidyl aminopeptidase/acylaminoacyl peptidase [Pedobacter africanus]|uniref:Dipeptidyl aminopeptidase/acylaminoacyl peptidase n=1 Tax=Pedobacter africanus TaxID=151894 RepID=A0ACC6KW81_9SPHI|nr:prolyl oligopeptidase family serine peptidase [Pedobacter africanus]MDR6783331.1 dipeptidyl aminopeptidase/acylaminoacyl peptidase [Pedobacter africanus]
MMKYILLTLMFAGNLLAPVKAQSDTIAKWRDKFATLSGVPMISPYGNWISIHKTDKTDGNSSFVVSTKAPTKTVHKILHSRLVFLNEEGVLGQTGPNVEFLNLITGKTYKYDNIEKAYILEKLNRYALLTKDRQLRIYNTLGKELLDFTEVEGVLITDSKRKLFHKKENAGRSEIIEISGDKENVIYTTQNPIRKIELNASVKQLVIIETTTHDDRLVVLDVENAGKKLLEMDIPKKSMVELSPIQEGKSFLISARVVFTEEKDPIVEIWHGNDPYVNEHYKMFVHKKFWILNPKNSKLQEIKVPQNNEVNSLNNDRYFLTYLPRKGHNFITSEPELNEAKIYDLKLNTSTDLGNLKLVKRLAKEWPLLLNHEIFCSADGKWFLGSNDGGKWILYNCNGKKEALIERTDLEQPVFSKNGDYIYFESSNDLWSFNIQQQKLTALGIGKGKMTKIRNYISERDGYAMASYLPTEDLLAEVYDKENNIISYTLFQHGKWKQVIPPTENRLTNNSLMYDPDMKSFYTLEENFNLPPTLYSYNTRGQKHLLFDGNIKDNGVKKIRQKIYSYSAVGKNLSGILYYPVNFDPTKKHPMIVRIYDMQRHLSNGYLSPFKVMPEGSQIRTLLEQGYFVYLPDTTVGEMGPGLSALECVNNALDVVLKNPNIDHTKIGLCGQSYGGYKTNFISTHSNRFAAYVSGAGISDIITNFYSYSYVWNKPLYFIYNTVYQMGTTPAADKERYLKNNPILNVEKVNAPILLWAGKKDKNVPYTQTMEFYIGLRRYKKDVIALFYQNGDHSFPSGTLEEKDLSNKVLDWWDYFLKDKKNVRWIDQQIKKDNPS